MSATPLLDESGHYTGAVCMVADMTERRQARLERDQLEARLAQSQRLETVGQLAGGIAHDFNNLLAVILNYAYFVRQQLPEDSSVRADIDEIRRAAERASELTHQLLVFSRREAVQLEVLDVNEVVRDMERLMRRTMGENVVLVTELDQEPCMVKADAAQLEQVVLNLVVNSRDAMPGGGTVTISTSRVELTGEGAQASPALPPGPYVLLSVRDDGEGMAPDVATHAFEPFFTTKPKGAGTGLGLATVYGTVTQCGGEADIQSSAGAGTEVRVWLPETRERASRGARHAPAGANGASGATVLVVEDEDAVRQLTCRILESGGFRCLSASDGEEALRLHGEADPPIDLLLTDVVIPGMSGRELAERISAEGSEVPVLFMSGYTDDVVDGGAALVQKPFTAASLLRSVHQALGNGGAG
jgi:two-component system, cell cycle sensor histidine kinase and response regulator CckA